jgi:hypothetical protein
MARPKGFDQDSVLRKAIHLFYRQGFAATSTDDLMRAMDVGRQSMYDTFGDKRALFLKSPGGVRCGECSRHTSGARKIRFRSLCHSKRSSDLCRTNRLVQCRRLHGPQCDQSVRAERPRSYAYHAQLQREGSVRVSC